MDEFQKILNESQQFDDVRELLGDTFNNKIKTEADAVNLSIVLAECLSAIVASVSHPVPIQMSVAVAIGIIPPEVALSAALETRGSNDAARATAH
jgi:hypothetical protein